MRSGFLICNVIHESFFWLDLQKVLQDPLEVSPNTSTTISLINFLSFLACLFLRFSCWWWLNAISFERRTMQHVEGESWPSLLLFLRLLTQQAIIHARGINHFSLAFRRVRAQWFCYSILRGLTDSFKCKFNSGT